MSAAPTAAATGTQSASINTEHTLFDSTTAGVFSFHVDPNAMVSGDTLELRIYQMVLTGGTRRVAYYKMLTGAQAADDMIQIGGPIGNELTDSGAIRCTLKQTAGTGRSFPWKVLQY